MYLSQYGPAAKLALLGLSLLSVGQAEVITGLVSGSNVLNGLVTFDSATPGMASAVVPITGTEALETILGIDIRPTTGELFGLGSNSNLYVIDRVTGMATLRGALTAPLSGNFFGVDFNPVPDLAGNPSFRIVSNTGQNLRTNANTGQVFVDGMINPAGFQIVGSAYTNNDLLPFTGTTLFGIDAASNSLVTQNPANAGTVSTIGALGATVGNLVGFDISGTGLAFLSVGGTGSSTFHTVNLATGAASTGVDMGSGLQVRDIAAMPAPVPEPSTWALLSLGIAGLAVKKFRR